MGHIREVEFKKERITYNLTIDAEDPDNLIIEDVVIIDSPFLRDNEKELDSDEFADDLDADEWRRIRELLEKVR